ncbi:hypothetical protein TanjilG_19312 [Lupinus angustifolius]|uniref:DNA-directed RNA polymerase subunit n=1 Tax=Lupinus angustifolius TaxID=3871 RepID=A0A1J7H1Q3_LUPAN|nr:hypothetical protein TanjilG_19312 [Lupinus angustifolius]
MSNASTINHHRPPERLCREEGNQRSGLLSCSGHTGENRRRKSQTSYWGSGDVLFPVVFNAITFKIFKGEILEGVVHKVLKHGVFMRCGPIENVYLSNLKMPGYHYVPGENPCFMNEKMSKVGKDVAVRFCCHWYKVDGGRKGVSGVG